jgi:hypothetical protein
VPTADAADVVLPLDRDVVIFLSSSIANLVDIRMHTVDSESLILLDDMAVGPSEHSHDYHSPPGLE